VGGWYKEKDVTTETDIWPFKRDNLSKMGHYSQVMWSKSYKIGCAYVVSDGGNEVVVYCNYAKAGNYENQFVFQPGDLGAECIPGSSCPTKPGLCQVTDEVEYRKQIGLGKI